MDPLEPALAHAWHRAREIRTQELRAAIQYAIAMWFVERGLDTNNVWLHRADSAFDALAPNWNTEDQQAS